MIYIILDTVLHIVRSLSTVVIVIHNALQRKRANYYIPPNLKL